MKIVAVLALFVASAAAFNAPQFATRAVGAKKPVKKTVAKKTVSKAKPPPESKGYPSFAAKAQSYRLGKSISGGGNRSFDPVFIHPTINMTPAPSFDYKAAAKGRSIKAREYVIDDGLTELERKQRKTLPAFLTGSAKSQADKASIRGDVDDQEYPFGLNGDRFQLLFITFFGLFTLVGCLSGSVSLD